MTRIHRLLTGPAEVEGVARLDELWSNLRAAFDWACATGDHDLADALVRPLVTEINTRGQSEIGDWSERILALHDVCAHAGGPLNEGKLVDGAIECPWHASRYRMTDGHVLQGPSVYDQPAYEVRAKDGGGWEARRQGA